MSAQVEPRGEVRAEESRRFGSRAFARRLVLERGEACPSGRHARPRIELREAPVVAGPPAQVSRRRLLPFEVLLNGAGGARSLFRPGPFDELRCYQRRVVGPRHDLEYLTWLPPQDQRSEGFRPFGCLRLDRAEPLVDLPRQQGFWLRLRAERGLRVLPQARVRGPRRDADGLPREGLLRLEPALASGPYRRAGQPDLEADDVEALVRARARGLERIAWLEEAFRAAPPEGMALHRYYLDADLTAYLVRQEGLRKVVCALTPSAAARAQGLLVYPDRGPDRAA